MLVNFHFHVEAVGKQDIVMVRKKQDALKKETCQTCGGSGQVSSFQGVSRFLLSWEECPECCGLGYIVGKDGGGEVEEAKDASL